MKLVLAGCVAVAILLATSVALAAHGYTDTADDENTAPDITSLDIAESETGTTITIQKMLADPTPSGTSG